jgi:hypothetical protein
MWLAVVSGSATEGPAGPNCTDLHRSCSVWAKRDECERNPSWMYTSCARACSRCVPELVASRVSAEVEEHGGLLLLITCEAGLAEAAADCEGAELELAAAQGYRNASLSAPDAFANGHPLLARALGRPALLGALGLTPTQLPALAYLPRELGASPQRLLVRSQLEPFTTAEFTLAMDRIFVEGSAPVFMRSAVAPEGSVGVGDRALRGPQNTSAAAFEELVHRPHVGR